MTHAEAQDLLLDLAFGELDAGRRTEVESHLAGCAECRKEKAELEEARRLAAPLRESEEPPPGFDDRILEAARAQARLDHDGNVGKVIEVASNVRPLGVEAARIDAHGPVKVRPVERRRPRWMMRVALGGSVAAAAALALVVSTTLETRRTAEKASRAQGDEYRIRVQPAAPEAVGSALRDAQSRERGAAAPSAPPPPAAPVPSERKMEQTVPPPQAQKPADSAKVPDKLAAPAQGALPKGESDALAKNEAVAHSAPRDIESADTATGRKDSTAPMQNAVPAAPQRKVQAQSGAAKQKSSAIGAAVDREEAGATAVEAVDAATLEARAQQARHAGNYALAASLYRSAAAQRRRDDEGAAAWDLAHAVECLAAAARFDEARALRDELSRSYPAQTAALSAAQRAVREVDLPATPK